MKQFILGVIVGACLVSFLAVAQSWEQPKEEGNIGQQRRPGQFVPEPPVFLFVPERAISEDAVWNEKQQMSLERTLEELQDRMDKQDETVMMSLQGLVNKVWEILVQLMNQINAMYQSQR